MGSAKLNAFAHYLQGNVVQSMGNETKAITYYKKSLKFNRNLTPAYEELGDIYSQLKQNEKAIDYYEKIVNNVNLHQNHISLMSRVSAKLIFNYLVSQNYDDAIERLKKIKKKTVYHHVAEGIIALHQANFDKAKEAFGKGIAVPNRKDRKIFLQMYIDFLLQIKDYDRVVSYIEKIIELDSSLSDKYLNLIAYIYFEKKKYSKALNYLNLLKIQDKTVLFYKAICCYHLNNKQKAKKYFLLLTNRISNPDDLIVVYYYLNKIAIDFNDIEQAVILLESGIKRLEDTSNTLLVKRMLSILLKYDIEKFVIFYEKIKYLELENPEIILFLVDYFRKVGSIEDAMNSLQEYLLKDNVKDKKNIYYYFAELHMEVNQYLDAISRYEIVLESFVLSDDEKANVYNTLAYCYLNLEKYKEAKDYLDLALKTTDSKINRYQINELILLRSAQDSRYESLLRSLRQTIESKKDSELISTFFLEEAYYSLSKDQLYKAFLDLKKSLSYNENNERSRLYYNLLKKEIGDLKKVQ